jgi:hypothetical protein
MHDDPCRLRFLTDRRRRFIFSPLSRVERRRSPRSTATASSFDQAICACAEAEQTAALSRLLLLIRNVLGEYPDNSAFDRGRGVEQVGCDLLDSVSMGQKLRLPGGTQGALDAGKFVHRSVTDLTFDRFAVVKHRKPKRQSFEVLSQDFTSRQRHRNILNASSDRASP